VQGEIRADRPGYRGALDDLPPAQAFRNRSLLDLVGTSPSPSLTYFGPRAEKISLRKPNPNNDLGQSSCIRKISRNWRPVFDDY
jgi:hypothetical protein